jgi:hypothetical protein
VLSADHVENHRKRRCRDPLGSIHKSNQLMGHRSCVRARSVWPQTVLRVSRVRYEDRPGHLRQHGTPSTLPGEAIVETSIVDGTRAFVTYPSRDLTS